MLHKNLEVVETTSEAVKVNLTIFILACIHTVVSLILSIHGSFSKKIEETGKHFSESLQKLGKNVSKKLQKVQKKISKKPKLQSKQGKDTKSISKHLNLKNHWSISILVMVFILFFATLNQFGYHDKTKVQGGLSLTLFILALVHTIVSILLWKKCRIMKRIAESGDSIIQKVLPYKFFGANLHSYWKISFLIILAIAVISGILQFSGKHKYNKEEPYETFEKLEE